MRRTSWTLLCPLVMAACYWGAIQPGVDATQNVGTDAGPGPDARGHRPELATVDCQQRRDPPVFTKSCLQIESEGPSNLGCRYHAVPTANAGLNSAFDHNFGVVVHNPSEHPAQVQITREATDVVEAQATVPAGGLHTFRLPLDLGLKLTLSEEESRRAHLASYLVASDQPVVVYQFNPLDYMVDGQYSHSNDAALVLPEHALSTVHLVMTRATFGVQMLEWQHSPGFVAVMAPWADTEVTVIFTAHTEPGPELPAYAPGDVATFTLAAGEVLQVVSARPTGCPGITAPCPIDRESLYAEQCCDAGPDYDLTGTRIESTKPVAVFSGHNCTFVPFDTWACDHLEEQMPPLEAWSSEYLVIRTYPMSPNPMEPEPNRIRLLSAVDGNRIHLDPPQWISVEGADELRSEVRLDAGRWVEFETWDDVHLMGEEPFAAAQFIVGEDSYRPPYIDPYSEEWRGDPSMGLAVPMGQFRTVYRFLAPTTVPENYVSVVKPVGTPVYLDGCRVLDEGFTPVGTSGTWEAARIAVSTGAHTLAGDAPFGVTSYGFARYTSYLYAAGQNLHTLCDVP